MEMSAPRNVTVLYFGPVRSAVRVRSETVTVASGATVTDLGRELARRHQALGRYLPFLRWAVDGEYVKESVAIPDGAEVALIPPVAGGSGKDPRTLTRLSAAPIDVDEVRRWATLHRTGATSLFLGTVRDHAEGRTVTSLRYECYEPMARRQLERIAHEALDRFPLHRVAIVHRHGRLPLGDEALLVVASSAHRSPAFEAVPWIVDEVKRTVPIWKHERYADGETRWVGSCSERQDGPSSDFPGAA